MQKRLFTPWHTPLTIIGRPTTAGSAELADLGRALSGALFVSLPLLFTEEMWLIARSIDDGVLAAFIVVSMVINRLLLEYSGYRSGRWQTSLWWDVIVVMGVGAFASTITLYVAGIISTDLDWYLSIKTIALEMIPTSLGASIAINQLGSGDRAPDGISASEDVNVLIGTLLGGYVFAFNIAPTAETELIVFGQSWWHIALTAILSVLVSYMVVAVANLDDNNAARRRLLTSAWFEAIASYLVAFTVSLMLLWLFGYADPALPLNQWLPQTVVLGYATTLGGAAGRLIL